MGFGTRAKQFANAILNPFNIEIDSCTAERARARRLAQLHARGHFDRPIFPVLPQFRACDPERVLKQVRQGEERFAAITSGRDAFPLENDYFTTPDAEVLYALVQLFRPAQIVEIGSGNSTHLFRKAIMDAGLKSHLTSVDPEPRRDVSNYADEIIKRRVEDLGNVEFAGHLGVNDIFFIDSSHQVAPANDVNWLVLNVLPSLAAGVLVHFHDIFLPYEYPEIVEPHWNWAEQYLVQAFLIGNDIFEVLWAGHYLQKTYPKFAGYFGNKPDLGASSLWLRKR